MSFRLVVARPVPEPVAARMSTEFDAVLAERDLTLDEVVERIEGHAAEALFFSSNLKLTEQAQARLPASLKVAATCSVGFDHIDVAAARRRGLIVTNTPDVLNDCTADLTFLLILGACRRASEYLAIMRDGWRRSFGMHDMLGVKVSGRRLGILGMGRIGRAVAARARGFGMEVLYCNPRRLPEALEAGATYYQRFEDMLPHCEILTLHAPAGPATEKVMNATNFGLLPKGAVFVNAARGSLVDEEALIEALTSGQLFAAGLDVFLAEPAFDTRLAALPNTFLTPHMGSATLQTRTAMGFRALDNIQAVLEGREAIDPL